MQNSKEKTFLEMRTVSKTYRRYVYYRVQAKKKLEAQMKHPPPPLKKKKKKKKKKTPYPVWDKNIKYCQIY